MSVVFEHTDEDGDRLSIEDDAPEGLVYVEAADSGVHVDPRELRDALTKHLGEPQDERIAAWERVAAHPTLVGAYAHPGPLVDGVLRCLDALVGTPYRFAEATSTPYQRGSEAGYLAGRASAEANVERIVSAVEVELFREAWAAAEPGNRIRSGLEAVEHYRTWKAQS